MVQAVEPQKRSTSSNGGGKESDTETIVHHPRDFSPQTLPPNFQTMSHGDGNGDPGEGPSGYGPDRIYNPKTRAGPKARKASYSSDEE